MDNQSNEVRKQIATLLKFYREKVGLTVYQVGDLVGKSGKTVSAWENNRGQPDADIFLKLCDVYKVENVSVFFGQSSKVNAFKELSTNEADHIKKYRALDERGKITVDKCLNEQYGFIEQDQSLKEETATVITHPAFSKEKVIQTVNVMDGEMDDEIKAELREYAEELMAAKYGKTSLLSENIEKEKDLS